MIALFLFWGAGVVVEFAVAFTVLVHLDRREGGRGALGVYME